MDRSHTMEVTPTGNVDLADIKKYGGFYIIQGDLGYVAIMGGRYGMSVGGVKKGNSTVASESVPGIPQLRKFIKEYAGKPEKYWKSSNNYTNSTRELKSKRERLKTVNRAVVSTASLFERFKPLFVKVTEAAVADIRGVTVNMIKNGNYKDAERKLRKLSQLDNWMNYFGEHGTDLANPGDGYNYDLRNIQESYMKALANAVALAAQHYAGDEIDPTSNIEDNYDATQQLFADIQNGDTKKLSTVLTYFKNGLLR